VKQAFLFPGQGSEGPGMGGALLERPGPVRELLGRASHALGLDLAAAIARGSPALTRTDVSQPALTAVCIGIAQELAATGIHPEAVCGHSVGELAAFCVAGCLDPEEAVDCAVERGKLMAEAARRAPGGMAAVRVREDDLPAVLAAGAVELAAHNAPEEWVVSGGRAALAAVAARFPAVPLSVSGPWHSRAMAEAEARFRERLRIVRWRRPRIALVANATGDCVTDEELADLLAGQLTRPVRWATALRTLLQGGISSWRVVGPGRILRGLCRANLGPAARIIVSDGQPVRELCAS
jgi:[acyl-carrier-protein] S-malonyltransferase